MSGSKKYPFKRIDSDLKHLKAKPEGSYGFVEDNIWYPNELFIEKMHEMLLKELGGYTGYDTGIHRFKMILAEAKAALGIYNKAAVFLRRLITDPRIYKDGNHRLAQVTVETFLAKNQGKIWTDDSEEICRFIKHALEYSIEEISEWLENGPKERSSNSGCRKGNGKKV